MAQPDDDADGTQRDLSDDDWTVLLQKIKSGFCTPFLGAGASAGTLPLGGQIAARWAQRWSYPRPDTTDLARVAQFLAAIRSDGMSPKLEIKAELESALAARGPPDFGAADEPHGALAELPLPVFLSTNYDSFMFDALRAQGKHPAQELCRWNELPSIRSTDSVFDPGSTFQPTADTPIVFHLHGHLAKPSSMVLTEDDYLDFLVAVASKSRLLPGRIQEAIGEHSLLFVGYRLADWSFRVVHRGLVLAGASLRSLSVTVQVPTDLTVAEQRYMDTYFRNLNVHVYWGTAQEFAAELRRRWRAFEGAQ